MVDARSLLAAPILYQRYQEIGGFFGARLKAIQAYLPIDQGSRIIDIGCGPGYLSKYVPKGSDYLGFDIDDGYITFANKNFCDRGRFFSQYFDASTADQFGPADIVMLNGVIHHMDDQSVSDTLLVAKRALKPNGRLFTLDGCYRDGQSPIARRLLDWDRGKFVRTQDAYLDLVSKTFRDVDIHVRDDLSWVPYTFAVMVARNS